MKVSIIIVSKNRPDKLKRCIKSLMTMRWSQYEIIIVDQGSDKDHYFAGLKINKASRRITYIHSPGKGLSKGRNLGISMATGDIICFTDDDCIADPKWIHEIASVYKKDSLVMGVFGNTLPADTQTQANQICPAITPFNTYYCCFSTPQFVSQVVGIGNNMSFRKSMFHTYGYFNELFGHGSFISAAEDSEYTLRLLFAGRRIARTPRAIVYHDRWVSNRSARAIHAANTFSDMICYGRFIVTDPALYSNVFWRYVFDLKDMIRIDLKLLYSHPIHALFHLSQSLLLMVHIGTGTFLSFPIHWLSRIRTYQCLSFSKRVSI